MASLLVWQVLGTLRQIARQNQVPMRNAAQDLRESRGSWRRPDNEGATAGGRDGSHSEGPSSRVRQAFAVPSLTE